MRAMSGPEKRKRSFWSILVVVVFAGTMAAAVLGVRHAHRAEGRAAAKAKGGQGRPAAAIVERPLGPIVVSGDALAAPKRSPGTPWDAPGNVQFRSSVVVTLGEDAAPAAEYELSLDLNDVYELRWLYRGREVGAPVRVGPSVVAGGGLAIYRVATGAPSVDAVVIAARAGDGMYSVGHIVPVPR